VLLVAVSFLFVGFCWTANHLISSAESNWPQIYSTGETLVSPVIVVLRMLIWVGGACGSMSVVAAWQLASKQPTTTREPLAVELRRLAWLSLGGLAIASAAAVVYLFQSDKPVRALCLGRFAFPYAIAAVAGVGTQVVAWVRQLRERNGRAGLALATLGWVVSLLGVSVLRESVRLASVDLSELHSRHASAAGIGGLGVFVVFAVLNTALIAACVWLVRRKLV
jgi:hypothetical protein